MALRIRYLLPMGALFFSLGSAAPRPDLPVAASILSAGLHSITVSYESIFTFTTSASPSPTDAPVTTMSFDTPAVASEAPETTLTMSIVKPNGGPAPDIGTVPNTWPPEELKPYPRALELCFDKDFSDCIVAVTDSGKCQEMNKTPFGRFWNRDKVTLLSARVIGGTCTLWNVPMCQVLGDYGQTVDVKDKDGMAEMRKVGRDGNPQSWKCFWDNAPRGASGHVDYIENVNMPE